MKQRAFLTLALLAGLFTMSQAQTAISNYRPGVTPDGIVYFLPKTAIRVSVLVEKTTYEPGEFCKYAERYLRLNGISQEPSVRYRIVGIQQDSYGIPDTAKAFVVKFNAKTAAANAVLTDDGILLAINAQVKQAQKPVPFKAAQRSASVNPRKFMSEEILAAGSTAKMAELTAREIYDLRENRNMLIKGQADFMPHDGAQMKIMMDQIETQDRALTQLFQGTTIADTTETILYVKPDGSFPRQVLFRLSQKLGIVDADDLSGTPYYISIEDLNTVPATDEEAAKAKKKPTESGVYVNVPGKMRSTIFRGNEVLSSKEYAAGQFGKVELLSGELFNKRYTTHLILNPATGGIEKLEAEQPK